MDFQLFVFSLWLYKLFWIEGVEQGFLSKDFSRWQIRSSSYSIMIIFEFLHRFQKRNEKLPRYLPLMSILISTDKHLEFLQKITISIIAMTEI